MKKLTILLLAVCLASASFATIITPVFDFVPVISGNTLTLYCLSGIPAGQNEQVGFYDLSGNSSWSNGQILGNPATAGSLRAIAVYSDPTRGYGFDITAGSTGLESPAWNAQPGPWFSVTVTGLPFWWSFDVEDVSNGYASLGTIAYIPEPATLLLLGLGGLLIRRRTA